jgi:hypothetical protein
LGRLLCRLAIVGSLCATALGVVLAVREFFGDNESFGLLFSVGVIWSLRLAYFRGLLLQGHVEPAIAKAAGIGRNVLTLPLWLLVGYYFPAIEQFGWWCVKVLPVSTFHVLDAIGLPNWLALTGTIVVAPFEVIVVAVLCTVLVLQPAKAIFGEQHPVVEALGEALPHVTYEGEAHEAPEKPQAAT